MKLIKSIHIATIIFLLSTFSQQVGAQPDFSWCDDVLGKQPHGLCRAAIAADCLFEEEVSQQCSILLDLYVDATGTLFPWILVPVCSQTSEDGIEPPYCRDVSQ